MTDYISREAAISWACENCEPHSCGGDCDLVELLKEIPAADVREWKRGKWEMKPDPYGFFDEIPVCSVCGCTTKMRETYIFCPNCAADMRGEDDV